MKPAENPFRSSRIDGIAFEPQASDWPQLLVRLEEMNFCGAVVGPYGSGKTTLLFTLAQHLQQQGLHVRHIMIRPDDPPPTASELWRMGQEVRAHAAETVVMVDGADHLPQWKWQLLRYACREARGLVIAAHREGLLPTWKKTRTSAQLLERLMTQLLRDAPRVELPAPAELYARHEGNIRSAFFELYDRCADAG